MFLEPLVDWLCQYPCLAEAAYLAQGFTEVFIFLIEGQRHVMSRNLKSIKGMDEVVRLKIKKELEGGHLSGSHKSLPQSNLRV